jgi:hypothetical protein
MRDSEIQKQECRDLLPNLALHADDHLGRPAPPALAAERHDR